MQGHTDEFEYLKNQQDDDEIVELSGEGKDQLLKVVKYRLFNLFFRLNTLKISVAIHYYMLMVGIEAFQLLTLALVDGSYSTLGPYGTSSPWNLEQTQWLIDVCWVFRIDRYFRTSYVSFIVLISLWSFFIAGTIALGVLLSLDRKVNSSMYNFLCKVLKALITLLSTVLFIPIMDTFAFAIKCSLKSEADICLGLDEGYLYMILYVFLACIFVGVVALCSMLYYDFCLICGGIMAKPHPRFKLLRLASYIIIIFSYYFITTTGKVILYLVICLLVGLVLCYVFTQYMPYYNKRMCNMRLGSVVSFTSSVFCMLIGEFFRSTDQTNSSVTMLFYFLTPCLVQITQLAMVKRGKMLAEKKIQQITNPYQVEIKARLLVYELENAKNRNVKSIYGENDEEENQEFLTLQENTKREIENLFSEAFKKFPNAEYLYLWSGLLQLHIFENFILAMVQCFKGLMIANKLDSQYALYQFRRTAESFYKAHMKDDAYDYELFEKTLQNATKNDEAVTRSQLYFWAELESKSPKIQKLTKLAGETAKMIAVAKTNYQKLLKLNSKNTQALRMYGGFLSSLNNFSDVGQRYLQKADMQDEAQSKNINANVMNSLTQPLSFFDNDNAIIRVSGDFETIGEIQKANAAACHLLGYLQAELVGRNVSLIIPQPFGDCHDDYMKKFHDSGKYSVIDNQGLVLYFANKNGNIFEARLLVKVVPNEGQPPFLSAIIKPTNPQYEVILMSGEMIITGYTQGCSELFELSNTKNTEQKINNIISRFEDLKESMLTAEGIDYMHEHDRLHVRLKLKLFELKIGEASAQVLKIHVLDKKEGEGAETKFELGKVDSGPKDETKGGRPVSILQSLGVNREGKAEAVNHSEINLEFESTSSQSQSQSQHRSNGISGNSGSTDSDEEESDEESGEESEEGDESESESEELEKRQSDSTSSKQFSYSGIKEDLDLEGTIKMNKFPNLNVPADHDEDSFFLGNESKPLITSSNPAPVDLNESKSSQDEESGTEEEDEDEEDEHDESRPLGTTEKSKHSRQSSEESSEEDESEESGDDVDNIEQENNDAHSVYSSSKSMNSSMASLAQFNKSIKALVSYEFSKTKKYVMRFKLTLIFTIIVLIITSILTFEVIDKSVRFNEELSHYVNLVGNLRLYTQSLSYYVRMISLMDKGWTPTDNRDLYFTWMEADIEDMHSINLKLYKNYELLNSDDRDVYIEENIATWLLEGGLVREIKSNLFDATSNFILQGFLLKEQHMAEVIDMTNRRAFYLYRNGNGETLQYLNTSASFYVRSALEDLESQRIVAVLLIVAAVILLFFCAGFAIIPAIRTLEKSKREVWEIFFEIPEYVCRIMKAKCSERLSLLNENNNIELEEQQADELHNEDDKDKDEGGKKSDYYKSKDDKEKKSKKKDGKKNELRKILAYDPRQRKIMTIKLLCFFIISLVYFYLIYYTGFDSVGKILKEEPIHINWASRRRQLSRAINMWVTETLLENTTIGYKYVVPANQDIGFPRVIAQRFTEELDYVENSLIFGNDDEGITFSEMRSKEHDDLLFENACTAAVIRSLGDCEEVGNKAMMQGLHSALGMYINLARTLILQVENLYATGQATEAKVKEFLNSNDMSLLRNLDNHYLYDPLKEASDLYERDYRDHQDEMTVWQNVLMALYCVFSLLFFFFVYSPMINKIGLDCKNAWSMCTLIPQEYQEDFKKLNAAIKERRDNFKWR
jgi:PAS domain S-box-containing protein